MNKTFGRATTKEARIKHNEITPIHFMTFSTATILPTFHFLAGRSTKPVHPSFRFPQSAQNWNVIIPRLFASLLAAPAVLSAQPVISEFLTNNSTGLTDFEGDHSDWIEIHNPGPSAINLNGWHLSDDLDNSEKWTFPSVSLAAGEYLVVFASGKNLFNGPELHTNFSLARSGESVVLTSPDSTAVSSYTYPEQSTDISYGSTSNGNDLILVAQDSPAKALIPDANLDSLIGTSWQGGNASFDDSGWLSGALGVGLERTSGFQDEFGINVGAAWGVNSSVYIRVPFSTGFDPANIVSLTLRMKYDDGFAAFLNGIKVAEDNAPSTLAFNSNATRGRPDASALQFTSFDLTPHINELTSSDNLLAIHGLNQFSNSGDLLMRPELVVTLSTPVSSTIGFFPSPSPGEENPESNFEAILDDTNFEVGRGIFHEPFDETIASTDPGATLIYTTDGSLPSPSNGTQVPASGEDSPATLVLPITTTTIVRVMATRTNALPTNVDTQTYLFPEDVLAQDGTGLPTPSNSSSTWDYVMDPNIANDPRYPNLSEDLISLPTLSISLPAEDMWGQNGIYANPTQSGPNWERACSVEYLLPDGSQGFQEDAGLRIHGAGSRFRPAGKKSLRISFRSQYGASKLDYDLFSDRGADRLDHIVLRGAYFDSWSVHPSGIGTEYIGRRNALLLRDEFGRQTHQAMGAYPVVQGNWAHVYFNGMYWGLYNLHERIDQHFAEDRFGNDDSEYDVLKQRPRGHPNGSAPEVVSGDLSAWNTLLTTLNGNITSPAVYQSVREQLDVDSFIDYLVLNFWGANLDWPHNNWYAIRHRPSNGRFTFVSWDVENFIFETTRNAPTNTRVNNSPGIIWDRLRRNEEFLTIFADRVQYHCFNQGALTPSANIARFENIAGSIRSAMNGEAARWGDTREEPPLNTIDHFDPTVAQKVSGYFLARTNFFINQLRRENLFPDFDAPLFSERGGQVVPGSTIIIANPNASGTIYYTLDGTDPRLPGGSINPSAETGTTVTINSPLSLMARVRLDNGTWSALSSADFITGTTPVAGQLVISEIHYHPASPTPSELDAGFSDQDDFEFIELTNTGSSALDLTGLSFTTGIQFDFNSLEPANRFLPANGRLVLARNASAFTFRYGPTVSAIGTYEGSLANSGETLTLTLDGMEYLSFTYNDRLPWPESSDGDGPSLVLTCPRSGTDHADPLNWQPSPAVGGSPLDEDTTRFIGDPTGDDNQDGLNNLFQFAFSPDSSRPPSPAVSFGNTQPVYTFQRNLTACLVFTVQHSTDLSNWTSLDASHLVEITPLASDKALYTYRSPVSSEEHPAQFFRIFISTP
ncbi:MAG: lamin tail domain-containing protein [Akkermansiaceae bacterium]